MTVDESLFVNINSMRRGTKADHLPRYHATESLIQTPRPRKHYRAFIPTPHWQLRSLVCSPEKGIVYYPNGFDIVRLNTHTRERETITTLSFEPRCLTASRDWICCGGDDASFTAIYVGAGRSRSVSPIERDADARLPLSLRPGSHARSDEPSSPISIWDARLHYPLFPTVKTLGQEIINCITLWFPPSNLAPAAYPIPVAVVARNDCVVSILSLRDSAELEEVVYPDFVNRALLSPDGSLLVAVCDDPYLYIHSRRPQVEDGADSHSTKPVVSQWKLSNRVQIQGQFKDDRSTMRGSFAACFSPSGQYLAVATQHGIISIFDVRLLADGAKGFLITSFPTTRPHMHEGAVRAMQFSPGPFDLLAWTEAVDRVGIADLRDMCTTRQIISLDSRVKGVERVLVSNRPQESVLTRIRDRERLESLTPTTPDHLGLDLERRHMHSVTHEMQDRRQAPLTDEEMHVLQAHQIARDARDRVNDRDAARLQAQQVADSPQSSAAITTDRAYSAWRGLASNSESADATRQATRQMTSQPMTLEQVGNQWRLLYSNQGQLSRNPEAQQTDDEGIIALGRLLDRQTRELQRREALVQSRSSPLRALDTSSRSPQRGSMSSVLVTLHASSVVQASPETPPELGDSGFDGTMLERLRIATIDPPTQSSGNDQRLHATVEDNNLPESTRLESDPWDDIETLYRRRLADDDTRDDRARIVNQRLRIEVEDEPNRTASRRDLRTMTPQRARRLDDRARERRSIYASMATERDFANRLRQPWRASDVTYATGSTSRAMGAWASEGLRRANVVDTTGLDWSTDGRIL